MPKPRAGESQEEFLERCIPMVIDDGTAEDSEQAAAICYSLWEEHASAEVDTPESDDLDTKLRELRDSYMDKHWVFDEYYEARRDAIIEEYNERKSDPQETRMMHKTLPIKVESKTEDGGRITISTGDLDRQRDRVMPFGARIDNYLKNPVVQYGHNYNEPWATVGRTTSIEITDSGIVADFELRPPANEQDPQNIVRLLWNGEWIRTASVGFNPIAREENDLGGIDFTEWELLEWSLVPVPANQSALRMALKALGDGDAATLSQKPPEPESAETKDDLPDPLPQNVTTTADVIDSPALHERPADVTEPLNDVTDAGPIDDANEPTPEDDALLAALNEFLEGIGNLLT